LKGPEDGDLGREKADFNEESLDDLVELSESEEKVLAGERPRACCCGGLAGRAEMTRGKAARKGRTSVRSFLVSLVWSVGPFGILQVAVLFPCDGCSRRSGGSIVVGTF